MTAKHKPKWGYQSKYLFSEDGIKIYADDEVTRLASFIGIEEPVQIEELRTRLEGCANIYRIYKNNHDKAPRPGEMKAAIEEIHSLVTQLTDRLEQMDDLSWQIFWRHENKLSGSYFIKDIPEDGCVEETEFGHKIFQYPDGKGGVIVSRIGRDQHFESLGILKNYCLNALEDIPTDKGARRKSEALRIWAINMWSLWFEIFNQEITITRHKGQPLSDGTQFCCEAFKSVDPAIPQSRVMTALEYVKREKKKKKTPRKPGEE